MFKTKLSTSDSAPHVLLKYRFKKGYRHPTLDASLTKARIAGEARAILKCLKAGVNVPGIRAVDAPNGILALQFIEGSSVRKLIPGGAESEDGGEEEEETSSPEDDHSAEDLLRAYNISPSDLMRLIGLEIAKMHRADVIHGDLTTSNMMLRSPVDDNATELVLIDFGLSYVSSLVEDKAVDLYVLERAFSSTHPDSEHMFTGVLQAYESLVGPKEWELLKRRLDDVRLRGRKRSMVG